MKDVFELTVQVPFSMSGLRFDQAASELFPDFSRSRLQSWIKDGQLKINGVIGKPKDKVIGGETLDLNAELEAQGDWQPEEIQLDIVHEDDDLLIINKQAGLVVHPAAGNYTGTLVNALLNHIPELINLPRAGIVHRLDKETTGLMVVAKTLEAHTDLVAQLADRTVSREYEAVAVGAMTGGGTVNAPMGRHPIHRKLMAVLSQGGKRAVTHYRVVSNLDRATLVQVRLETGRRNQIRVHFAEAGHPVLGDERYEPELARHPKWPAGRLALHARLLGFDHPVTGQPLRFQSPLPAELEHFIKQRSDK